MKRSKKSEFERQVRSLELPVDSGSDERVLRRILAAYRRHHGVTRHRDQAQGRPQIWEVIMGSRMARLRTAVVVALAGVFCLFLWEGSSGPVYGMTEAMELIQQARTLHIQGWSKRDGVNQPFEYWYDLENGCYRYEIPGMEGERDFEVCDGQYIMRATRGRQPVGEEPHRAIFFSRVDPNRRSSGSLLLGTFQRYAQIEGFGKIRAETIAGERFDIWQGEYTGGVGEVTARIRVQVWLSPATGAVGKMKRWKEDGQGTWTEVLEYTKFERDVPLAPELFITEPPATGYVIETTKEEAVVPERRHWLEEDIYEDTQFGYAPLNYHLWPAFLLPGGSILAGYQSVDAKESRDQSDYFEGLEVGGPLARLPVQVYSISPEPNTRNVLFIGFHLAHTHKQTDAGRRWFEWILYVPDGEPPEPDAVLVYRLQRELNVQRSEDIAVRNSQTGVRDLTPIETEEDFNRLILGAIADRSDAGFVPEYVTYENVLAIALELQASIAR